MFNSLHSVHTSKRVRKRSTPSSVSLALLHAYPVVSTEESKAKHIPLPTFDETTPVKSHDEETKPTSSKAETQFSLHYPNEEVFTAALELFNKQIEVCVTSESSTVAQRWECKGEIQASFQMCVLCKDVGKAKSHRDTYYLDVKEIRRYRTILCKGCLACILQKHIGTSLEDIEQKLRELNEII